MMIVFSPPSGVKVLGVGWNSVVCLPSSVFGVSVGCKSGKVYSVVCWGDLMNTWMEPRQVVGHIACVRGAPERIYSRTGGECPAREV